MIDMNRLFHLLSTVFSPLLVPTYGFMLAMFLTPLHYLDAGVQWATIGVIFFITAVIPAGAIYLMHRIGVVSDVALNERGERTAPYVVCCVCYLASVFYLLKMHAPMWLWLFMGGALLSLVINVVVTKWWKISAHMTAMGGLVGLLCRLQADGLSTREMTLWVMGAILLTGLVGSARIYRERHDLWQVLAGTVCGFACVFLLTMIR